MTFQQFGNYKLNRWIFRVTIIIILLTLLFMGIKMGPGKYIYIECNVSPTCQNPYIHYGVCEFNVEQRSNNPMYKSLCSKEFLQKGELLGEKSPFTLREIYSLVILYLCLTLSLNHIIHNRRFKWNMQD